MPRIHVKRPAALVMILVILFASVAMAATTRDPGKFFFDKSLGDYVDDLADARSKGKQGVLFFFHQEECPFCHQMRTTVLNQVVVQEYFKKHFLIFEMDIESSDEITDFKGKPTTMKKWFHKITNNRNATPVFAFFDLNGKLVVRYTGFTTGPQDFLWLGEYMVSKQYLKTTFSAYKRMKKRQSRQQRQ